MSVWLIMSVCKKKQRDTRQLLMYAVTLGEDALFEELIAKSVQFG